MNARPRYLIPLIILFILQASESKAASANVWPERQEMLEHFRFTEETSRVEKKNQIVNDLSPRSLKLNDDALQGSNTIWLEPTLLFQVDGIGEIQDPFILSDRYGNIHVFWTVKSGGAGPFDVIYYTRLDTIGWTNPVDIVAETTISAISATIGQDGFIYLIWNGVGKIISYSRAPILAADSFENWSKPTPLTDANLYASIVTSPSQKIYLAFADLANSGIFEQAFDQTSLAWSSPRMIAPNSMINTGSDFVQLRVSDNGTLHAVWTEFYLPTFWPPRGVFYSHSINGTDNWSAPILLAGEGFDQINMTVMGDNNVHVAWNGMAGVGGRYHRWSSDGGVTWSDTNEVIPAGTGGTEGPPEILVDQSGMVHMLVTFDACVWYTYFEDQRWSNPVCISGEKARASNYIEEPAMTISEGNKIQVVFWDDRKRLWYTTKTTEASWIPPAPIDVQPTPSEILVESPKVTPTSNSTSLLADQQLNTPQRSVLSPWQNMLLGLLPAILLIIVIAASQVYKKIK